ncbi:hypothetical protein BDB01DRAFT_776198 [Pilobolus umbonatus]|nr:hypothetical protein BDB01DRAFT_776198 [Pilobolus umbonatus]
MDNKKSVMHHYQRSYNTHSHPVHCDKLPPTPNSVSSLMLDFRECQPIEAMDQSGDDSVAEKSDYPQEITWLFYRDKKWVPFQSNNHYRIEQAFTLGGINY